MILAFDPPFPTVSVMSDTPNQSPKAYRARAVPYSKPFWSALFFFVLHVLALVATAAVFVLAFTDPNPMPPQMLVAGMSLSALTWMIAYFKRRSVRCPLCKGTPLINTGATPHERAWKILPFNYGISAILSISVTQRFCCMYCGTEFDLLKTKSRKPDAA
jgi:hypothetical protein